MSARAVAGTGPAGPGLSRQRIEALFQRELLPWALIGLALGLVEGATVAVLVKKLYAPSVSAAIVNFAVAAVSGAPALANIVSFAWANLAHGRSRVGWLAAMQAGFALLVGLIAFAPLGRGGLALTIVAVILSRMLWAGVLTLRAVVWSANYPRHTMARITGRIVILNSIGVLAMALLAGWALDRGGHQARWLYLLAALSGLLAAWRYRQVRVRREFQLLAAEADSGLPSAAFSLRVLRRILAEDPAYRHYMYCQSLYGSGNLMIMALLVVLLSDRLHLPGAQQILLLTVIPLALLPVFLPWWARLFDQGHVIAYRARQCWVLVVACVIFSGAVLSGWSRLLWVASVVYGIGMAGSNLGWNLGHNDFAAPGRAQQYMGVHVTLTGVRGLAAPPLAMICYEALESWRTGWGCAAMLLPVALVTAGAIGFVRMRDLGAPRRASP